MIIIIFIHDLRNYKFFMSMQNSVMFIIHDDKRQLNGMLMKLEYNFTLYNLYI